MMSTTILRLPVLRPACSQRLPAVLLLPATRATASADTRSTNTPYIPQTSNGEKPRDDLRTAFFTYHHHARNSRDAPDCFFDFTLSFLLFSSCECRCEKFFNYLFEILNIF